MKPFNLEHYFNGIDIIVVGQNEICLNKLKGLKVAKNNQRLMA